MGIQWSENEAMHLLNRAAFTASTKEVAASVKLGKEETVRRLIAGQSITDQNVELTLLPELIADGKNLDPVKINDQQTYWLYRMISSQAPLIEKMTLFWHGHFATSYAKVREIPLLLQQNDLFRKYALGNFHDLVVEVSKDPAMMLYLDSTNNKKGKPNENYAREVMELFTLGIGKYTEDDVKEAARALTGWNVNKDTGEVKFNKKQHDTANKTILNNTGNYDVSDMVEILFKQKALSDYMAKKILLYFGAPEPSQAWIDQISSDWASNKTIGEVMSNLFLADEFYDPSHKGAIIKAPVEYIVGIIKTFDLPLSRGYTSAARKMGQELYLPPDVAGWRGGTTWLMTTSLLARYQFAESVSKKVKGTLLTAADYTPSHQNEAKEWVELWGKNLGISALGRQSSTTLAKFAEDTFIHAAQKNNGMRGLLHLLMISPEGQMK